MEPLLRDRPPGSRPRIIAIEGPALVGKSTLLAHFTTTYRERGVLVIPCYAHVPDTTVPATTPEDPATELAALDALLAIEDTRISAGLAAMPDAQTMLLDRSIHSLLAHAAILDSRSGWNAHVRFREFVDADPRTVWPDEVIVLRADPQALPARAKRSHPRPPALLDVQFSAAFYEYFDAMPPPPVHWIDANAPLDVQGRALAAVANAR
jgi:thymidylate kinase